MLVAYSTHTYPPLQLLMSVGGESLLPIMGFAKNGDSIRIWLFIRFYLFYACWDALGVVVIYFTFVETKGR